MVTPTLGILSMFYHIANWEYQEYLKQKDISLTRFAVFMVLVFIRIWIIGFLVYIFVVENGPPKVLVENGIAKV